jgi:8-oxo-dGTP diphosphatase
MNLRLKIRNLVEDIETYDQLEEEHKFNVLNWIDSKEPLFRITKPDNPPKHLVSYFVLFDSVNNSILLIDHIKARLWLPTGGHVEVDEDPLDTVIREAREELNIDASLNTEFEANPFFITVTSTQHTDIHTDVSLWYIIEGDSNTVLEFDQKEMKSYRWLTLDSVLQENLSKFDPHMHRFVNKMKNYLRRSPSQKF